MTEQLHELPEGWMWMVAEDAFAMNGHGQMLRFEPAVAVPVKRANQPEALARGARPVDGKQPVQVKVDPVAAQQQNPASEEYRAAVRDAAEAILARNSSLDFGANGKPYAKVWDDALGWRPVQSVRDDIWDEVKQAHTVASNA